EEVHDEVLTPPGRIVPLSGAEAASIHRRWMEEGRDYGPEVHSRLEKSLMVTLDEYIAAQEWRSGLRHRTALAFSRLDLLATPACGATRKVIGEPMIATTDGEHFYRTVLSVFSALVNSMGCPAVVGPLPSDQVPPPALQLVAPWWQEHRLLEVAATLEQAGIFTRPA
ncbi:MAG TPA: amidase family protein, partial [Longimicrobiales bacterium]|nr:amidase family protein [Longimicrobiales bacterium]